MLGIMAIITAAVAAAGALAGGLLGAAARHRKKNALENQKISNEAWYNRRMGEDATQRADAQRVLTQTEDAIRNRNKSAAGAQAVMGGTEESLAATKAANASTLGDAASQIAAAGAARKDAVEDAYRERDAQLAAQENEMQDDKANQIAAATKGVINAASAFDNGSSSATGKTRSKITKTDTTTTNH